MVHCDRHRCTTPFGRFIDAQATTLRNPQESRRAIWAESSVWTSFFIYMRNLLRGDFGISFTQQNRASMTHSRAFPGVGDAGCARLVLLPAVFLGIALTAIYRNRLRTSHYVLVILGISVPSFVVAALSQFSSSASIHRPNWRCYRLRAGTCRT